MSYDDTFTLPTNHRNSSLMCCGFSFNIAEGETVEEMYAAKKQKLEQQEERKQGKKLKSMSKAERKVKWPFFLPQRFCYGAILSTGTPHDLET